MQTCYLHKKLYQIATIDETDYSQEVFHRKHILESYKKLKAEKCSEATILKTLCISRATYYRWQRNYKLHGLVGLENQSKRPHIVRSSTWNQELEQQVLKIRRQFPLWGKNKISVILKREKGIMVSVSMVGRILKNLINQQFVKPVMFYYGRVKIKRERDFKGHAKRWKYGMRANKPGELIQIDHTSIDYDNKLSFKHFKAVCPITRLAVEQIYNNATSKTAVQFLYQVKKQFPFPIESIQVDGGSEFMKYFEKACKDNNIDLYVLPPRSPELNGNVERGNSTVKYEFYYQYDGPLEISIVRYYLKKFVELYNKFRPHQALQYLTPWQYYQSLEAN